jgi:phage terminase large subunit-like protein
MSSPTNQQEFVSAVERCRGEIQHLNDIEAFEPEFHTCGHPALMQHLRNAKEYPTKYGMSIWKGAREADKKIDLAVCTVGARMLRRMMLNVGVEDEEVVAQEIWGRWSGLSVDQYSEGRW